MEDNLRPCDRNLRSCDGAVRDNAAWGDPDLQTEIAGGIGLVQPSARLRA